MQRQVENKEYFVQKKKFDDDQYAKRYSRELPKSSDMQPFCLTYHESRTYYYRSSDMEEEQTWYDICLMPEFNLCLKTPGVKMAAGHIYLEKEGDYFAYSVMNAKGEIERRITQLQAPDPFDESSIKKSYDDIIDIVLAAGYTSLPDFQVLGMTLYLDKARDGTIQYTVKISKGTIVRNQPTPFEVPEFFTIDDMLHYEKGILRIASEKGHVKSFPGQCYYARIPCLTTTLVDANNSQGSSTGTDDSDLEFDVLEGYIGKIKYNGKPEFIPPGRHRLGPGITFHGVESVTAEHIQHSELHVFNVSSEIFWQVNAPLTQDDESEIDTIRILLPGRHIFKLKDGIFKRVLNPYGLDVMVEKTKQELEHKTMLEQKNKEITPYQQLFVRVPEGKFVSIRDKDSQLRIVQGPGCSYLACTDKLLNRISSKEDFLDITLSTKTHFANEDVNITAMIYFQITNPYWAMQYFGDRIIQKEVENYAKEEIIKQVGLITCDSTQPPQPEIPPVYAHEAHAKIIAAQLNNRPEFQARYDFIFILSDNPHLQLQPGEVHIKEKSGQFYYTMVRPNGFPAENVPLNLSGDKQEIIRAGDQMKRQIAHMIKLFDNDVDLLEFALVVISDSKDLLSTQPAPGRVYIKNDQFVFLAKQSVPIYMDLSTDFPSIGYLESKQKKGITDMPKECDTLLFAFRPNLNIFREEISNNKPFDALKKAIMDITSITSQAGHMLQEALITIPRVIIKTMEPSSKTTKELLENKVVLDVYNKNREKQEKQGKKQGKEYRRSKLDLQEKEEIFKGESDMAQIKLEVEKKEMEEAREAHKIKMESILSDPFVREVYNIISQKGMQQPFLSQLDAGPQGVLSSRSASSSRKAMR